MMENVSVLKQVTALPGMNLADLKIMWKDLYNQDPPSHGKPYLVRKLAYRIQELAFGGLAESSEKRLDAMAQGKTDPKNEAKKGSGRKKANTPGLGTKLVREWKGREYVVMVMEGGFEYEGQKYRSLSAIAKKITGTHWSGPVFFGIKKNGGGK
ncbi:MAG: DUF2924 domain-containing protein [Magnetococcales bacterium]|nr:DUF2924 domain-containing protein [Magnetococcales bacterium]